MDRIKLIKELVNIYPQFPIPSELAHMVAIGEAWESPEYFKGEERASRLRTTDRLMPFFEFVQRFKQL